MAAVRWHLPPLLVALVLVCGVAEQNFRRIPSETPHSVEPFITDEEVWLSVERFERAGCKIKTYVNYNAEYIRHIHSMIDAYRGDIGGRLIIETNALIDTKYRTWKRNADMINSLLALPKGLNDAGR